MMNLGRTKKIGLIVSLCAFASCASGMKPFPAHYLYVADVTNQVCVKYRIVDPEKITVVKESEARLVARGDCDRAVGFHRSEFKSVQNWVRDVIEDYKNKAVQLTEALSGKVD